VTMGTGCPAAAGAANAAKPAISAGAFGRTNAIGGLATRSTGRAPRKTSTTLRTNRGIAPATTVEPGIATGAPAATEPDVVRNTRPRSERHVGDGGIAAAAAAAAIAAATAANATATAAHDLDLVGRVIPVGGNGPGRAGCQK